MWIRFGLLRPPLSPRRFCVVVELEGLQRQSSELDNLFLSLLQQTPSPLSL